MKQLQDDGQVQEFREEFKELAEHDKLLGQDNQLEDQMAAVKEELQAHAEPDDGESSAIKKQTLLRQSDQADKRETDPEYIQKLEAYSRAQQQLRLKHENFQRR